MIFAETVFLYYCNLGTYSQLTVKMLNNLDKKIP